MTLILHIGAHRTGTTAMQDMLVANRAVLAAAGVRALVHAGIEKAVPGFGRVVNREGWEETRAGYLQATRGAGKLLISEENMIGDMGWNIRSASFYWRAKKRLKAYRDFFGEAPKRIGIGIRGYASYWVSAHALELTYRDVSRGGVVRFADQRDRLAITERGWLDLVADARAVFPEAEILVWPVEAKRPVERLASRLIGGVQGLVPPAAGVNAAPDAGHIPAMEDIRAERPAMKRRDMRAWLRDQSPGAFEGFTADQRAAMAARYDNDLAALALGFAGAELVARPEVRMA